MANLTRLSVLIAETDADRSREAAELLAELGVGHVTRVNELAPLLRALKKQAFDVLICGEQLGGQDAVTVLRAARDLAPATRTVLMRANNRAGEIVPNDIEAIELPFSRLALQGMLHRTASVQGGLWCEVPELSLSDILQMYHQAQRSITVLLSGPIAGRIHIEAGEIVDADAGDEHGKPALSRLLEAESGLVRTKPLSANVTRTISAPFQSVILEAAHRLDERRRDSMAGSAPGSPVLGSSQPPRATFDTHELIGHEKTFSSGGLRPAMTPMLQALAPNFESFLAPRRRARRQSMIAALSVLASLIFVAGAALYLKDRIDISAAGRASDVGSRERVAADVEPLQTSTSEKPRPDDESSRDESPLPSLPRAPSTTVERPPIEREPAAAAPNEQRPAPQSEQRPAPASSFQLHITSKPSRAAVSEAGRVLGKTPLTLTIGTSSVARGPREFVVRLPGYVAARVVQPASGSNVNTALVLSPRPLLADGPDAGAPEYDLDPDRPGSPRPRPKDLGIRLRR